VTSRQGNYVILHDVIIILLLQELDTAVRVVDGRGEGSVLSSVWAIAVKGTLSSDEYFFLRPIKLNQYFLYERRWFLIFEEESSISFSQETS
jgi:hypothetical protein